MYEGIFSTIQYDGLSIDELVKNIKQTRADVCPYHYLKYIANKVDILLCPYNYVLNPDIRKSMGLNLTDKIIVFDEAHNIENISEDSYT